MDLVVLKNLFVGSFVNKNIRGCGISVFGFSNRYQYCLALISSKVCNDGNLFIDGISVRRYIFRNLEEKFKEFFFDVR